MANSTYRPLDGCLVVSIEQAVAAPLCTARLVDAGARVIKIERESGDFARNYDAAAKGDSSYFVWINQGKESLELNLKDADDQALLHRMIAKADIFVQNLAIGATERLGLGTAVLRRQLPKLITCDISGYGESEGMAGMKAYDFLVQAESGLVSISGSETELGRIGVSVCDIGAGMSAHAAILEALYRRTQTGKGAALKVSLFDVAAEWMAVPLIHNDYGAGPPTRQGLRHPSIAPYGAYRTQDGIDTVISIQNEREWQRFCNDVLQEASMASEPQFASNNQRVANCEAMDKQINAVLAELSADEFRQRMLTASIAFGALNSVGQFSQHTALRRREVINSHGASLDIPMPPVIWDDEPERAAQAVPSSGQHSQSIRAEFA